MNEVISSNEQLIAKINEVLKEKTTEISISLTIN